MRLLAMLRHRLRSLVSRKKVEDELDEEIRYHLEREIDERIAQGMTHEAARTAALRSLPDIEQRKEDCRDMRGLNLLESSIQDFRYALRQLRQSPGFTCAALFVLGLGISAAVIMFGFVDAALLRPLPYKDQSRLVAVFQSAKDDDRSIVSYLNLADWRRFNQVFSSIDAFALNGSFTLTTRTGAEQVRGTRVSAGFFHTLGVMPALGRDFRAGEDEPAAPHPALISYAAWQRRFDGRSDVIGRTIILNGDPTTIVGVLPRDFTFALYGGAEFWGTLRASGNCEHERGCNNLIPIARLKDGVSIDAAASAMKVIAKRLSEQYPDANRDFTGANLVPLRDLIVGDIQPILLTLLTGAGLLLLIACINVTALLLARSEQRQREVAVRGALGASSSRLIRQFATEGFVIAGFGGILALFVSAFGMRLFSSLIPQSKIESMPYFRDLHLNPLTVAFGMASIIFAGTVFFVVPILRLSFAQMLEGLKEGTRTSSTNHWRRVGSNLVVAEVAIAITLMLTAGLLGKSFYLLLHVNVGFNPDHLAAVQTSWAPGRYASDAEQILLGRQMIERVSKLPGVLSVALSNAPPVDSAWGTASFHVAGTPNHGESNQVVQRHISPTYFKTLQAHLLRGRYFREDEDALKPKVVIVNRTLANKFFAGAAAIGKQIYWDYQPALLLEIVGITDDIKEGALAGADAPIVYVPQNQRPWAWPTVLLRTGQNESALPPEVARAIHGIDPYITVSQGQTMTERINQSPAAYLHRSSALLAGGFAIIAFVLSVVGLYGVVAYSVNQRTREIGIRMALGAERRTVVGLVLRQAGRITSYGIALGLLLALSAARLIRSLLFGVEAWDPQTLVAVAGVLAVAALLASYIPARRAASVDPVRALRAE